MNGSPEGTVIVADVQTKGRGRQGREWISSAGGLWMSIILRPTLLIEDTQKLTILAGVAVAQAIDCFIKSVRFELGNSNQQDKQKKLGDYNISLLWPNDVFLCEKKVAGILVETSIADVKTRPDFVIVGIGVNVNNSVVGFEKILKYPAVSLYDYFGIIFSLNDLMAGIIDIISKLYFSFCSGRFNKIIEVWRQKSFFNNYVKKNQLLRHGDVPTLPDNSNVDTSWCHNNHTGKIKIFINSTGTEIIAAVVDIDEDGNLLIIDEHSQQRKIHCDDVTISRNYYL